MNIEEMRALARTDYGKIKFLADHIEALAAALLEACDGLESLESAQSAYIDRTALMNAREREREAALARLADLQTRYDADAEESARINAQTVSELYDANERVKELEAKCVSEYERGHDEGIEYGRSLGYDCGQD